MSVPVDARGLPCPQPVILTRNAMRDASEVTTLVSQRDQVDNVQRLAERAGWRVTISETDDGWVLQMTKGEVAAEPELTSDLTACPSPTGNRVLVVSSDEMGRGEPELGHLLMRSFFYSLREVDTRPDILILFNTGVRLALNESPVLDDLQALAADGLSILVCGTCLNYLNVSDQVGVGAVSNMYVIAETIMEAGHLTSL